MRKVFIAAAALSLGGCDQSPGTYLGAIERADKVPQSIVKNGTVYQLMSGEYVPIPISPDVPKEKIARDYSTDVGPDLTASIKLFYAYGEAHYRITFSLKKTDKKSSEEISQKLVEAYQRSAPYVLELDQNGFGIETIDLPAGIGIVGSYSPAGIGQYVQYDVNGSFPIGPTKYSNVDSAIITWH